MSEAKPIAVRDERGLNAYFSGDIALFTRTRTAFHLCPQCVFLPVDLKRYAEVSRRVQAVLRRFAERVEPVGLDEAALRRLAEAVASALRERGVRARTVVLKLRYADLGFWEQRNRKPV
ncbi:MAG: hypothetical protein ACFCVA_05860 [Gammaproteobacteria bacterium]